MRQESSLRISSASCMIKILQYLKGYSDIAVTRNIYFDKNL